MRAILGGYFETALVRYADEILRPDRNTTGHPYYMCLNRKVAKSYFDRAATFLALADALIVPSIDWGLSDNNGGVPELSSNNLGVSINGDDSFGGREWDDDAVAFANILVANQAFSPESWVHISTFESSRLGAGTRLSRSKELDMRRQIGAHYLCRLLLHIRAAADSAAYLVLSEPDCLVVREIGEFVVTRKLASPYPIPNLTGKVIAGDDFAAGLLNFSPPDALAMAAVRRDSQVRKYAKIVTGLLGDLDTTEAQRQVLRAMKEIHTQAEVGKKAEKIFEIASWCVKPLHYVPGIGEALTFAEDAKDLISKWLERCVANKEWYLIAARMTDVAINDYLSRKDNLLR